MDSLPKIELIFNHDGLLEVKDIISSNEHHNAAFNQLEGSSQPSNSLGGESDLLKQALDAENITSNAIDLFADLTPEDLSFLEDIKPLPAIQEVTVGSTTSNLSLDGFSGCFDEFKPDPLELEASQGLEVTTTNQPQKRGRKPKTQDPNNNWIPRSVSRPGTIKRRQKTLKKVEYPFIIILGLALQRRLSSRNDHIYNFVQRYFRKKTENVKLWRGSVRHALNTKKFFQKYNKAWCKGKVWGLKPDAIDFAVQSALSAFELNRDEYIMAMTHPDPELFDAMVEVLRKGPTFEDEVLPQEPLSAPEEPQECENSVNLTWNNNGSVGENDYSNFGSEVQFFIEQLPEVDQTNCHDSLSSVTPSKSLNYTEVPQNSVDVENVYEHPTSPQSQSKSSGFVPNITHSPLRGADGFGFLSNGIPYASLPNGPFVNYGHPDIPQASITCSCGLPIDPWGFRWNESIIEQSTVPFPGTSMDQAKENSAEVDMMLTQVENFTPQSSVTDLDEKDEPDFDLSKSIPYLESSFEGPSLVDVTQQYINMNW